MKKLKKKDKPYEMGETAFLDGLSIAYCPFEIGSDERVKWQDGWFDASTKAQKAKNK